MGGSRFQSADGGCESSRRISGQVPEWLKGTDCKSVGESLHWFESSLAHQNAGVAQLVERQLPKLNVAGSNPVSRSRQNPASWPISQESRVLGRLV